MCPHGNYTRCSAEIRLPVTSTAPPASSAHIVQLQCGANLQGPLCAALSDKLHSHIGGAKVDVTVAKTTAADLTVTYMEQNRARDWISGALAWRHRDGRSGQGPVIEHSVMDGTLTAQTLVDYAEQLVMHTEFPLQFNDM